MGEKGRSQGRVIRGGLVTTLLVWFSVENAPHALPGRELCPRLLQMLLIVCSRIILNNKQTNRHAWQLRPTGGRAERGLQEMGLPRGTQRVAWPPGPGGNALRPPRGPGRGLFDPGLKFLLLPRSCAAELHLLEPRAAALGLFVTSRARDPLARGRFGERA